MQVINEYWGNQKPQKLLPGSVDETISIQSKKLTLLRGPHPTYGFHFKVQTYEITPKNA
ncbi:hypothetical protein GCM10007968_21700 [Sporolactobacillus putidus]|uniref:Uncharacterized protein n=1 Tax=Sporolactobacillus putidus TaxID=492735 RepID=A0A917S4Y3_9BACL|nr:hypothetical protein GCM10007968_21700 [Sporolactobacillus putidus]